MAIGFEIGAYRAAAHPRTQATLKAFMKSERGTYAVVFRSTESDQVEIGRWGYLNLKPGFYVYVGSAFGPGGVRARVARHLRRSKRLHWHVDYLSTVVEPVGVWFSHVPCRLEHEWSDAFSRMEGASGVSGFGCSDCTCDSHLFFMPEAPDSADFISRLGGSFESCEYCLEA